MPSSEALLDRFLAGPAGREGRSGTCTASIHRPVTSAHATSAGGLEASTDRGVCRCRPDLLVSWRRPTVVILYTNHDIAIRDLGPVDAQGAHDANVILRAPADQSVFRDHDLVATVRGVDIPLADETQLIWDLQDLGGADRLEARGRAARMATDPPLSRLVLAATSVADDLGYVAVCDLSNALRLGGF